MQAALVKIHDRNLARIRHALLAVLLCCFAPLIFAEEDLPPLQAIDRSLELERFVGDWYVIASIPVKIPFFNDSDAYNYTERYEIIGDGVIRMTCEFNVGSLTGKRKSVSFKAFSKDKEVNTEWGVQFVWPFRATYLVIYLDDDYQTLIVAVPNRSWAWIMKRDTEISEQRYAELLAFLEESGFDSGEVKRISHDTNTAATANRAAEPPEYSYATASAPSRHQKLFP